MLRIVAFLAATAAGVAIAACNANLEEGCLSGVCSPETGATSATGAGGAGAGSPAGVGGGAGGNAPTEGDIPCDVYAVIVAKCQPCHQDPPKENAPFPILTWENTQEPFGKAGKKRYQQMLKVIQPNSIPHMPFDKAPPLTPAEFTTLNDWLAAGAVPVPTGDGCE